MNRLEVHIIFIHIGSDQQLSGIFPSFQQKNTFTQDHIATLNLKRQIHPFNFKGEYLVIDNHSYVLHTHFTILSNTHLKTEFVSNIIVAVSSNSYGGDSRNGGKVHRHHFLMYHLSLLCLLG